MFSFKDKNVVLGITGGIAAYKSCELLRSLVKKESNVRVVMTKNATNFITPLTLQTLSGNKVALDLFDLTTESEIGHITLADEADIIVVAPATASFIGKLASGIADSLLSTLILASKAPIILCPAMNVNMYENSIVKENLSKLSKNGFHIIEPGEGNLACGWEGKGRLPDTELINIQIEKVLTKQDLKNKKILVTAGATREYIDPVRFISNPSTGKMGYALASACWIRGADTTLISGHSELLPPVGVKTINVQNACEMYKLVHKHFKENDIIIKCAAVSDFTPSKSSGLKLKKNNKELNLKLEKTDDILKSLGEIKKEKILVGFAAETNDIIKNAVKKVREKNLDLIVANDVSQDGAGFGSDTNIAYLIDRNEDVLELPKLTKNELAHEILDKISSL